MKIATLFLLALPVSAQPEVTWAPGMDHTYVNGHLQMQAASALASVKVIVTDSGRLIGATVIIGNSSGQKFDLFPNQFTLSLLVPKKQPKTLDYVPPETVIGMLQRDLALGAIWGSLWGVPPTRPETTRSNTSGDVNVNGPGGTANGTYNATTTTTRQPGLTGDIDNVNQNSLRATTVDPGQQATGFVFFRRDSSCGSKNGCNLKLVLPVGNTRFEFPILMKKP